MPYNVYDFEVVVDPLIFDIRLTSPFNDIVDCSAKEIASSAQKFEKQVDSVLNKLEGTSYTHHNFYKTFGFQGLTREQSIQQALSVQESMRSFYSADYEINVGFSTLGLKKYEHIHKNILDYKNTPEFGSIMSGYIRFLHIAEYETWMES